MLIFILIWIYLASTPESWNHALTAHYTKLFLSFYNEMLSRQKLLLLYYTVYLSGYHKYITAFYYTSMVALFIYMIKGIVKYQNKRFDIWIDEGDYTIEISKVNNQYYLQLITIPDALKILIYSLFHVRID